MSSIDPLNPTANRNRSDSPHTGASIGHPSPGGPTIVIADDETHIRLVVGEKFRSEGFTVIEARDGEEALELVRAHQPDAIVTDLQMPYMNGVEFCTQVASDPVLARIPALLLTARGHIVDPALLKSSVIRKTMCKPFSAKALFENVQAMLAESAGATSGSIAPTAFKRPLTGEAA